MAHESGLTSGISRRNVLQATATAIASLACPAIARAAGETPIKVGLISPLTGAWTVYGKAHSAGFQLLKWNAGVD